MKHKDAKKMRAALLDALANGTQRPNPATGTMQTDGPMVQAPAVWQSAPDHPPTLLAYITAEEAAHLAKKDMHNSGVDEKPHFGPNGIPSFNGYDGSGGYDTGGDGGSGQGGVSDGTTGASVGADGSYTGVGGTYSDVNASISGVAGSMLGEDRLTAPNLGVPVGPNSLYGAQYAGWLGNRIGEQMDRMAANPISSALNAGFGLIGGPLGMVNTLSGWMGGPTVGSLATAGGRAAGAGRRCQPPTTQPHPYPYAWLPPRRSLTRMTTAPPPSFAGAGAEPGP